MLISVVQQVLSRSIHQAQSDITVNIVELSCIAYEALNSVQDLSAASDCQSTRPAPGTTTEPREVLSVSRLYCFSNDKAEDTLAYVPATSRCSRCLIS